MAINAQRALQSDATDDNYLSRLNVGEPQKAALRGARDEIRDALRAGLLDWEAVVERRVLFETAALSKMAQDAAPSLRPKFRMQGSWSYHTLNCTTHEPPQEIDLDDGMFLPVSFLSQNGTTHPAIVSGAYFEAVESILGPLCDDRGWELITDMPSCVRVGLHEGAHVDIALYAIPDAEFAVLLEKSITASTMDVLAQDQTASLAEEVYRSLSSDQIMLAHRNEGWKPSDPRKLEVWFQDAIDRHGYQLRRVCRYLKAWRDASWDKCRLSSIALMACVVTSYDEAAASPRPDRDDLALSMVADRLPGILAGRIANPVVEGQFLDDKWEDCRDEFVAAAEQLSATLRSALTATDATVARDKLVAELGTYMPTQLAYYVAEVPGPAILTEGLLKGLAADQSKAPAVKLGGGDRYG